VPRARGCTPNDPNHPRVRAQRSFAELGAKLGASNTPRGSADLSATRSPIDDQNGWSACTSFAASACTEQVYRILGKPLPWRVSKLALWTDALTIEAPVGSTAAQIAALNQGVQSVTMMIAMGHGIRALGATSGPGCDIVTGPVAPGLDQMTTAAMMPQVGEYSIDVTSPGWPTQAAICLDNNIPVYVGLDVGPLYDSWVPSMPPLDTDEAPGTGSGHAVRLDGYSTTSAGELIFTSPGSYGLGYADRGVWLFTANGLVARAFDVYPWTIGGLT
jgi:hypothetical protein